jgi:peptidoglycan/LPS O-acetylase OafA/YrhL
MRSNQRRWMLTTFACALALAGQAAAHPGHGLGGGSTHWLHYLTDPLHVAPLAAGVLALALAVRARRSAGARKR